MSDCTQFYDGLDCFERYNCCNCGQREDDTQSCLRCFSCNACDECYGDDE